MKKIKQSEIITKDELKQIKAAASELKKLCAQAARCDKAFKSLAKTFGS